MQRLGVAARGTAAAVTRDVDFLTTSPTDKDAVRLFADVIGGEAHFPHERNLTALVGQAIKVLDDDHMWNVDVIFKVFGNTAQAVVDDAPRVEFQGGAAIRVMHPLHVLKSRLDNLHKLSAKQTDQGEAQLLYAIEVVRRMMPGVQQEQGESEVREWIKAVAHLARCDAGKKIAQRRAIHVADAIAAEATQCTGFHRHHLPRLLPLMSEARRVDVLGRSRGVG